VRCAQAVGMTLHKLIVITPDHGSQGSAIDEASPQALAVPHYQLGLFIFIKTTLS